MADPMKNDFQNARKRGLHGWAQWRTDINDRLSVSTKCGTPVPEMDPIHKYLKKQLPKHHPAKNPQILMSYSADPSRATCLKKDNYLIYGIPRAKVNPMISQSMGNLQHNADYHPPPPRHVTKYGDSDSSNSGSNPDYVRHPDMVRSTMDIYDQRQTQRRALRRTDIEDVPEVRQSRPEVQSNDGDFYFGVPETQDFRRGSKWKSNHNGPRTDLY